LKCVRSHQWKCARRTRGRWSIQPSKSFA